MSILKVNTIQTANGTTALSIAANGELGVGTTLPADKLDVTRVSSSNSTGGLTLTNTDNSGYGSALTWNLKLNSTAGNWGRINVEAASSTNTFMRFFTTNGSALTEQMRIDSAGRVLFGTTNGNPGGTAGTGGISLGGNNDGNYYAGVIQASAIGNASLVLNRSSDDGNIVILKQGENTEGTISVSGTTVSYNGGHLARYSQLPTGQRDVSIVKGTVMSNLDAMCEWLKDGEPTPNEQLNKMKVSDVEGDKNVAGVFVNWDNDDKDNTFDMNIAMTGDMIIRIAQGVTVQRGDLLMSAGDGTAKPRYKNKRLSS